MLLAFAAVLAAPPRASGAPGEAGGSPRPANPVAATDVRVFMGSTSNADQVGDTARYPRLLATRRVSVFLNSNAAAWMARGWRAQHDEGHAPDFDGRAAVHRFLATADRLGTTLYEADLSPALTPSVPAADYRHVPTNDVVFDGQGRVTDANGTFQTYTALGWRPTFATLNLNFKGSDPGRLFDATQQAEAIGAVQDLKRTLKVRAVFPYVTTNGGFWTDNKAKPIIPPGTVFARSNYYASGRAVIAAAGAVALDLPVSMAVGRAQGGRESRGPPPYPSAYLQSIVGEIHWAKDHGYAVMLYVSPFEVGARVGQFGVDPDFQENVRALIGHLRAQVDPAGNNALPHYWQVGQYSPNAATNSIGTDTDAESVSAVATVLATANATVLLPPGFAGLIAQAEH